MNTGNKLLLRATIYLFAVSAAFGSLEHRKSELTVAVRSLEGQVLEGAAIEVEMLNHTFRFGTAVTADKLEPGNPGYDEWTATEVEKYFNSVTFGNVMKWSYYEARTPERMLDIVGFAQARKAFGSADPMRVRGHTTIWGAFYQVPSDVRSSDDGDYIHNRIINHITDYHTTFKDSAVKVFDIYNEPFHETEYLMDDIVPSKELAAQAAEIAQWFNAAKAADPDAILYINDYNMLNFWNEDDADIIEYKALVDAIRDAGGQIDGIGLQAHMDRMITKEQITRRLNILAAPMAPTENYPDGLPGLRLEVTELDININNWNATPEEQAILTANVLEGSFEHPAIDGITIWGMNDFDHWRDNSILFDDLDETTGNRIAPVIKPSGQVWIDRVTTDWWTNESGQSDSSGEFITSVFKGKHKITVTYNGVTKEYIQDIADPTTLNASFDVSPENASTYSQWEDLIAWNQPADSEKSADPDGDGRNNFEEYVRGSDPLSWNNPAKDFISFDSNGNRDIHFTQRTMSENVDVSIEYSENLSTWLSYPEDVLPSPVPPLEFLTINEADGISYRKVGVDLTGFYRLKFEESDPQ